MTVLFDDVVRFVERAAVLLGQPHHIEWTNDDDLLITWLYRTGGWAVVEYDIGTMTWTIGTRESNFVEGKLILTSQGMPTYDELALLVPK